MSCIRTRSPSQAATRRALTPKVASPSPLDTVARSPITHRISPRPRTVPWVHWRPTLPYQEVRTGSRPYQTAGSAHGNSIRIARSLPGDPGLQCCVIRAVRKSRYIAQFSLRSRWNRLIFHVGRRPWCHSERTVQDDSRGLISTAL